MNWNLQSTQGLIFGDVIDISSRRFDEANPWLMSRFGHSMSHSSSAGDFSASLHALPPTDRMRAGNTDHSDLPDHLA